MRALVDMSRGLILISVVCYLAAIVIALPLGVPGIVRAEWSLIPLGLGGITLGLGMVGEVSRR